MRMRQIQHHTLRDMFVASPPFTDLASASRPSRLISHPPTCHALLPRLQLLLTAGLDKKLRLFTADGLRNPLLQAVHLDDLPVTAAAFAPCAASPGAAAAAADRVVLAGRRPFFYVFDMGAGRVERVLGPAGCGLKSLEHFDVSPPRCACMHVCVGVCGVGGWGAGGGSGLTTARGGAVEYPAVLQSRGGPQPMCAALLCVLPIRTAHPHTRPASSCSSAASRAAPRPLARSRWWRSRATAAPSR